MGVTMPKIELNKKIKLLTLLSNEKMPLSKAAKITGLELCAASRIKNSEAQNIENIIKECAKVLDGGLPYLLWPELVPMKKNEKETEADLKKRIKYLEVQVAYYEELSKLEGLNLKHSSKKNDSGQSSSLSAEE